MALVAVWEFNGVRKQFHLLSNLETAEKKQIVILDLSTARGKPGTDCVIADDLYQTCWYQLSRFRDLYPEYKDMSDGALVAGNYKKASESLFWPHPWQELGGAIAFALVPPALLLGIAFAFAWALAGFRPTFT